MSSDTETQQPSDGAENPESNVKKSMTSKIYEKLSSASNKLSNVASNTIDKFRTIEQLLNARYTEVPIDENEFIMYNSKECTYIVDSSLYRKDVDLYIVDRDKKMMVNIGRFTGKINCYKYNPKELTHGSANYTAKTIQGCKKYALFNNNGVEHRNYFYSNRILEYLDDIERYQRVYRLSSYYVKDGNNYYPNDTNFRRTYALKTDLAKLDKTKAALDKTNATELDNTKAGSSYFKKRKGKNKKSKKNKKTKKNVTSYKKITHRQ